MEPFLGLNLTPTLQIKYCRPSSATGIDPETLCVELNVMGRVSEHLVSLPEFIFRLITLFLCPFLQNKSATCPAAVVPAQGPNMTYNGPQYMSTGQGDNTPAPGSASQNLFLLFSPRAQVQVFGPVWPKLAPNPSIKSGADSESFERPWVILSSPQNDAVNLRQRQRRDRKKVHKHKCGSYLPSTCSKPFIEIRKTFRTL